MIICNHHIQTSEIIGIGPLMVQYSPDQTMRTLYNERRLFFYVHTKHQSIKIESVFFQIGTTQEDTKSEFEKKQLALYREFHSEYDLARKYIIELLQNRELVA